MPIQTSASAAANSAPGVKEQIPTLSRCVNPDGISWPAIWYFPTSAAVFPICSYCYDQHIQSTPHAGFFEAAWVDGSFSLICQWNTPRVMSHLAANDWDAINAFMVERVKIPACKGLAGHTGPDGSRWYGMTDAWEIQGFVICEACYHDLVAWSQLKGYFTTTPTIKSDEGLWTCDAAVAVIKEGLRRATTSPNGWDDLHLLIRRRMEYPSCMEMKNLQAGSTHWYGSKAVPDLIVCTACYLDHFVLDHAESWELLSLTAEQQQQQLDCAMQTVQIYFAWVACKRVSIANNTDEYGGFEDLARIILMCPPCSTDDMRNATWYTPKDCTGDVFAICKRCFVAFMVGPGFVTEFKEVNLQRNGNWVCDLNPATPRCLKYLAKYEAAVKQENFSIFSDFVSEYAALPDCPRDKPYKNRKWYGKGGFTACELCYKEAVEGTSLASCLDCAIVPNEARCQMYTPRMRNIWQQACENNDLDSFLVLAKERMHVFMLMSMEKQRVELGQLMRMQQRQALMLASTINKGSESLASVVGNNGGAVFGNTSIGFNWNSAAGAESHQQFLQAMGINVVQAEDGAALMPLMQRWAQLE